MFENANHRARKILNALKTDKYGNIEPQPNMEEHYKWNNEHMCIERKIPKSHIPKKVKRKLWKQIKSKKLSAEEATKMVLAAKNEYENRKVSEVNTTPDLTRRQKKSLAKTGSISSRKKRFAVSK